MQIRYRRILTIKLLISRNFSSMEVEVVSLVVYFYIFFSFVDVDMVSKNGSSYVLSCVKTCVVSTVWQEIPQSFDPHLQPFSIRNVFY